MREEYPEEELDALYERRRVYAGLAALNLSGAMCFTLCVPEDIYGITILSFLLYFGAFSGMAIILLAIIEPIIKDPVHRRLEFLLFLFLFVVFVVSSLIKH